MMPLVLIKEEGCNTVEWKEKWEKGEKQTNLCESLTIPANPSHFDFYGVPTKMSAVNVYSKILPVYNI